MGYSNSRISRAARDGKIVRLATGLYISREASVSDIVRGVAARYPRTTVTGLAAMVVEHPSLTRWGILNSSGVDTGKHCFYLPVLLRAPRKHGRLHNDAVRIIRTERVRPRVVNGVRLATPAQICADVLEYEEAPPLMLKEYLAAAYRNLRGREAFARDMAAVRSKKRDELEELARLAPVGTASQWERDVIGSMRRGGLEPIPNFKLGAYYWDVGIEDGTTVIDLDSIKFHAPTTDNHDTFIIGAWKSNQAVQIGWAPLRFTDDCTRYHMDKVIEVVAATARHRAQRKGTKARPKAASGYQRSPVWGFHEGISFARRD